jgi:hypothetical protein
VLYGPNIARQLPDHYSQAQVFFSSRATLPDGTVPVFDVETGIVQAAKRAIQIPQRAAGVTTVDAL